MTILIIRFSSLGDVVMATAAVEAVSTTLPGARLHVLTKKAYAPLFDGDPRIEKVTGITGGETPAGICGMTGRSFDAVVDLHGSIRSRAVAALLDAPLKLRLRKHTFLRRLMIWSHHLYRRKFDTLGNYLETLEPLNVTGRFLPRLIPSGESLDNADRIVAGFGSIPVGIAPGAKHTAKRWNEDYFARLADDLDGRGYCPVFIGDTGDTDVIGRIRSSMSARSFSLAGTIGLADTVAVVSRFSALVTNDSGPMHIAGALGVPFVAMFGPTHPDLGFDPGYPSGTVLHSGARCSPCSVHGERPCRMGRRFCMDDIGWEMVRDCLIGKV